MKIRMAIKLTVLALIIIAAGYLLHGHDLLTAVALSSLLLLVAFKTTFALIARHHGGFPPGNGGGDSADRPEPRPPGGSPSSFSAAEQIKHEPA
jgi:hypothetical protein